MARAKRLATATSAMDATTARPSSLAPGVLITFRQGVGREALDAVRNAAGAMTMSASADFGNSNAFAEQETGALHIFQSLGVAVMAADPDQGAALSALSAEGSTLVAAVEPEPIFFAFGDHQSYLQGYRDGVADTAARSAHRGITSATLNEQTPSQSFADGTKATWGLDAVQSVGARFTGKGVKVAVLDTGLDFAHPDFRGRAITSSSFIPGEEAQDLNGHGTHCTGTACGAASPQRGPRYAIASNAEIYIGKVLANQGSARGRSTIAGIEWAVEQGCRIVSMSLGARVKPGEKYLVAFETVARQALRRNTLIVAAAGNDSRRSQNDVRPISSPANCPSILSVAAVDFSLATADFSNGAVNEDGKVDLCAPGVAIVSSAPDPAPPMQPPFFRQWTPYSDKLNGTSQATPHVAGVAALLLEEHADLSADELWRLLVAKARPLPQSAMEVGAGLLKYL